MIGSTQGFLGIARTAIELGSGNQGLRVAGIRFCQFLEDLYGVGRIAHLGVELAQEHLGRAVVRVSREIGLEVLFGLGKFLALEVKVGEVHVKGDIARIDRQEGFKYGLRLGILAKRAVGSTQGTERLAVFGVPLDRLEGLLEGLGPALEAHVEPRQAHPRIDAVRHQFYELFEFDDRVGEVAHGFEEAFEIDDGLYVRGVVLEGLPVHLEGILAAPLVAQNDPHVVAGLRIEGIDPQNAVEGIHGLAVMPPFELGDAQIVHGLQPTGPAAQGRLVLAAGIIHAPHRLEGEAVVEVEGGIVSVETQALAKNPEGLLALAKAVVHGPQVVVGGNIVGIELDDLGVCGDGGFVSAHLFVDIGQIVVKFSAIGFLLDGPFKGIEGVAEAILFAVEDGEVVEGFGIIRFTRKEEKKLVNRLVYLAQTGTGCPQKKTSLS